MNAEVTDQQGSLRANRILISTEDASDQGGIRWRVGTSSGKSRVRSGAETDTW